MTAALEARLAAVEAGLARVADERAIADLMYRYIEACDHVRDASLIGSAFADDATWEGANRYACWGTTTGRDAIVAMFEATPDVLPFTVHWLANPRIDVDGDAATGRWEVVQAATFGRTGTPVWVGARYDNRFRRTDEGWRIQHLVYADVFVTPFDQGWVTTPYVDPFAPAPETP